MNVLSTLPRWAQAPAQSFIKQEEIAGTEVGQMDQDSFQSFSQLAAGVVTLTSNDEVQGQDEAMGQPGVVVSNGLTINFTGDASKSEGTVEAVVTGKDEENEVAMYIGGGPTGFSALQMVKTAAGVVVQGGAAEQTEGGLAGYVIAGKLS